MPAPYSDRRVLHAPGPLSLHRTLRFLQRGATDPTLRLARIPGGERAELTARPWETRGRGVAARLDLHRRPLHPASAGHAGGASPHGTVLAIAWGEDPEEVRAFLDSVPDLLGFRDDWTPFLSSDEYRLLPEALRAGFRRVPGLRLAATGWPLKHAVQAVAEQRVTGAEAIGAWQRLVREHGAPPPSPPEGVRGFPPDLRVVPTPAEWLDVPSWSWHEAGMDPQRSRASRAVAEAAPRVQRAHADGGLPALARALADLPGIGPWTVAETLQRSHGLADAVSVGDYHLAHLVCYALEGRRGDDARMLQLLSPWAGNRQRVVRMIGAVGPHEPRRGPRVAPDGHRYR